MTGFYFAEDGNWGDNTGLVEVDSEKVEPHFFEIVEMTTDYERSKYAAWFKDNDHDPEPTENPYGFSGGLCEVCDHWENGDLPENGEDE